MSQDACTLQKRLICRGQTLRIFCGKHGSTSGPIARGEFALTGFSCLTSPYFAGPLQGGVSAATSNTSTVPVIDSLNSAMQHNLWPWPTFDCWGLWSKNAWPDSYWEVPVGSWILSRMKAHRVFECENWWQPQIETFSLAQLQEKAKMWTLIIHHFSQYSAVTDRTCVLIQSWYVRWSLLLDSPKRCAAVAQALKWIGAPLIADVSGVDFAGAIKAQEHANLLWAYAEAWLIVALILWPPVQTNQIAPGAIASMFGSRDAISTMYSWCMLMWFDILVCMALRMLAVIGQLQKIAAQRPAKKRGQECKSPMQCSRGAMWAEWLQLGSHATCSLELYRNWFQVYSYWRCSGCYLIVT